jgi:carbohydrate-selective porin OprB
MMTTSLSAGVEVVAPLAQRPKDSYGLGLSWAKLNDSPAAYTSFNAHEVMVQLYGRLHLGGSVYAQPVVSWLPVVGFNAAQAPSTSVSLQLSTQF